MQLTHILITLAMACTALAGNQTEAETSAEKKPNLCSGSAYKYCGVSKYDSNELLDLLLTLLPHIRCATVVVPA